ncbi:CHAP domain-containing protein [Patescibacteria group bacterium]|nr:CHAP domain-containing protein [Patescibacteria group bacterium]
MKKAIYILLILLFLPQAALAFTPTHKFTDQLHDIESNLYYYDNRYYDPQAGRFTQPDPMVQHNVTELLADPQSLNPYAYARNNPIRYLDPTGLSTATFNPIPEGGWQFGQEMGQFNGVTALYNGIGSPNKTYSCVDYAKRYMSDMYGIKMGVVGNPKVMWNNFEGINKDIAKNGSEYSFVQHYNGEGFTLPGEGDLLIWTEGTWGHVMVVTESGFDNDTGIGYVEIIDQNANNSAVRNYNIEKTDIGYLIMKNKTTPMAGWLSPVKNSPSVNSSPAPTATPQPLPQQNFWQETWTAARNWFKNLFNN